jgi:hypothetical protein
MKRLLSCAGASFLALLVLARSADAQTVTPAVEAQYHQNTATRTLTPGATHTPTKTSTATTSPTVTLTPTPTKTATSTPTTVEQRYPDSTWHKTTELMEAFPGLSLQRVVTETANAYFALASLTVQNTNAETAQVVILLSESPAGLRETKTVDVPAGLHTIQLPHKFINLSTGWHTFSVSVAQSSTGPLIYQDSSFLGVWDISYSVEVVNQIREIFWPASGMGYDGTLCRAPALIANVGSATRSWGINCDDRDGAEIYGEIKLPTAYTGTNFTMSVEAVSAGIATGTLAVDFSAVCAPQGARTDTLVFGTEVEATAAAALGYDQMHGTTAALTPGGDCASDPYLYWKAHVDAADTDITMTDIYILGVRGNWNP